MPEPSRDWFRILELPPDASIDAIKRSYRSLVKLWHPDRYAPGSSMQTVAQEKIKYINLAYAEVCKIRGKTVSTSGTTASNVRSAYASAETSETKRRPSQGRPETAGTPPPRPKRTPETAPPPPKPKRTPETAEAPPKPSRPPETADAEEPNAPPPPPKATPPPEAPVFRRRRVVWPFVLALAAAGAFAAILVALHGNRLEAASPSVAVYSQPTLSAVEASASTIPSGQPAPRAAQRSILASASIASPSVGAESAGGESSSVLDEPSRPSSDATTLDADLSGESTSPQGQPGSGRPSAPSAHSIHQPKPADAIVHAKIEAAARNLDAFTVGSAREEVVKLQGPPDEATGTLLRYGSSLVYFSGNKVTGWKQVDVVLRSRAEIDVAFDQAASFTVGSTKAEVLQVQGKPDHASDSVFQYGSSTVQFFQGRVVSWREGVPPLKARLAKDLAYGKTATFTVGSTRADVLTAQGPPDSATDSMLRYGTAFVRFENGRVTSWQDPAGILRARVVPHLPANPKG